MIPFIDLQSQYQSLKDEINPKVEEVMSKCNFILGQQVQDFEAQFADFCGVKYCVGVASGTDAMMLALKAAGVGPGDEVITVANTFVATLLAITYTGATPVLVDCDPITFNLDVELVEAKITKKTKVILPVHLYGQLAEMEPLLALANKHHLLVVEDACQAHGAERSKRRAGSFGATAGFSFYPGKNLGAFGDGGAVVTNDKTRYELLCQLRNLGSPKKYHHDFIGHNSRLDTLQAAVLQVKLTRLDRWNHNRAEAAALYDQKLAGLVEIERPALGERGSHVFHLYVLRTSKRDELLKYLWSQQIGAGIHYPIPTYSLGAYQHLGLSGADFPVTERYKDEILSLPMFPEITEEQIDQVVQTVKDFFGRT